MEQESILNRFLVEIFHELLRREDEAIAAGGYPELSSREMDVIKTVCAASDQENSSRGRGPCRLRPRLWSARGICAAAGTIRTSALCIWKLPTPAARPTPSMRSSTGG